MPASALRPVAPLAPEEATALVRAYERSRARDGHAEAVETALDAYRGLRPEAPPGRALEEVETLLACAPRLAVPYVFCE